MDLQEWKKKGNVWKLESEAFKKPIEIKIWFENSEIAELNARLDDLDARVRLWASLSRDLWDEMSINNDEHKDIKRLIWINEKIIQELWNKLEEERSERRELLKEVATLKSMVELQNWTILRMQEQVKLLEKKTTKQPSVFHDKCFISWRESSGIWVFNVEDGDYLLIMKIKIWEHNEYVINEDELFMDKIHVEGQHYVPFYKLEWGTELDTPTATIYYDLIFMPI
jgi:predicted RNase H-like nuclease (RuvC/YqgF family)